MSSICILVSIPSAEAAARRRATQRPERGWGVPQCGEVTGNPAVTFSRNGGSTLAPTRETLQGFGYTLGLVAIDRPDTLVAVFNDDSMISTDAGCSWRVIPGLPEGIFPPYLVAAKNGRVYGWSDNRQELFRIDEERITMLKSPIDAIIGVGVDPRTSDRLKIGSTDGAVWESNDAGATWTFLGGARLPVPLGYRMAFDSSTLDHIVLGSAVSGAFVSLDGGVTWRQSTGFTKSSAGANVFNVRIAPSNGSIVWAMALDMGDDGSASRGRYIFRSTDGGLTFEPKVAASPEVTLINGPTMAVDPRNADVLYFIFGTYFQGYGTDIFRFDASSSNLAKFHNDYDDINSIVFSPATAPVMYFGLEVERGAR